MKTLTLNNELKTLEDIDKKYLSKRFKKLLKSQVKEIKVKNYEDTINLESYFTTPNGKTLSPAELDKILVFKDHNGNEIIDELELYTDLVLSNNKYLLLYNTIFNKEGIKELKKLL